MIRFYFRPTPNPAKVALFLEANTGRHEQGGRFFVIAVSRGKFMCDGNQIMGISTQAPIHAELEGKRAGDAISFNGRELVIAEVA